MRDRDLDFTIERLGECRVPSPMSGVRFTRDDERVLYHARLEDMKAWLDKDLRLRDRSHRGAAGDLRGQHRGGGRAQRDRG
jgi:hypothetical protein